MDGYLVTSLLKAMLIIIEFVLIWDRFWHDSSSTSPLKYVKKEKQGCVVRATTLVITGGNIFYWSAGSLIMSVHPPGKGWQEAR